MTKLKAAARRILASYLRALVGAATAVATLDTITELRGVIYAAALATIPAVLRAIEAVATDLDPAN